MIHRDPRSITTAYLWRDTIDDLPDAALVRKPSQSEAAKDKAIRQAIAILGQSMNPDCAEAEHILRSALK